MTRRVSRELEGMRRPTTAATPSHGNNIPARSATVEGDGDRMTFHALGQESSNFTCSRLRSG